MGNATLILLVVAVVIAIVVLKGFKVIPQQQAWILERLGKFQEVLQPGFRYIIPFIDRIAYKHTLKEEAIDVASQTAITKDNVSLTIDGVVYVKVIDPTKASYGVTDPYFALVQLAQTTMRSEIGKMTLDHTFEERDTLNVNIVNAINDAAVEWGIQCMRYEIKDINPPKTVLQAMELQVAAEREKRAAILDSEGKRQAQINIAEAEKQEIVLASEAAKTDQINRAEGEAQAILTVATATAEGLEKVAVAIQKSGGKDAVSLKVAEQYVRAFEKLAQESTTLLLPSNASDAGSMVAQALAVFDTLRAKKNNAEISVAKAEAEKRNIEAEGNNEPGQGGSLGGGRNITSNNSGDGNIWG